MSPERNVTYVSLRASWSVLVTWFTVYTGDILYRLSGMKGFDASFLIRNIAQPLLQGRQKDDVPEIP